jgi:hypothetical protein
LSVRQRQEIQELPRRLGSPVEISRLWCGLAASLLHAENQRA